MPTVILEGQSLQLTDEQTASDQAIVDTLLPFYPDVAQAKIRRRTLEDGTICIELVKGFGSKGNLNDVLASLYQSSSQINPALSLSCQLKFLEACEALGVEDLIALNAQIENAIAVGEGEIQATQQTAKILKSARAIALSSPLRGI